MTAQSLSVLLHTIAQENGLDTVRDGLKLFLRGLPLEQASLFEEDAGMIVAGKAQELALKGHRLKSLEMGTLAQIESGVDVP